MTPVTLAPNVSGTASRDSSIIAVPAICSANSWFAASPIRSGSPVSATRPVMPRPTFVGRSSTGAPGSLERRSPRNAIGSQVLAVAKEHAAVVVVDELPELVRDRQPDWATSFSRESFPDRL